jgi:hypothetical protein
MSEPEVGTVMKDGSVYAGISPETGGMMYVRPRDASMLMTFNEAAVFVESLNEQKAQGHDDWRFPTKKELDVIFKNREQGSLKRTFNLAGADYADIKDSKPSNEVAGWYRTSDWESNVTKWCQLFKDGTQAAVFDMDQASVRFVRVEKSPVVAEPAPPPRYVTPAHVAEKQRWLRELARERKMKVTSIRG